jgi:hypothetical protein
MADSYTTVGQILQVNGENSSTWGDKTDTNWDINNLLVAGFSSQAITAADVTPADVDGVADAGKNHMFKITGVLTGNRSLILPTKARHYVIWNTNSGAFTTTVKTVAGTGIVVPQNTVMQLMCDGTNIVEATTAAKSLYVGQISRERQLVPASGSSVALDLSLYNVFDVTLTANCTFTFTNPPVSGREATFTLILRQNGTGGWSSTFPVSVTYWQGTAGLTTAPSLTTTASYVSVLNFLTVDGGTSYGGWLNGSGVASGGGTISPISGTYVAVGTTGKLSSSTDGSAWTLQASQFSGNNIGGCDYYSGRFHFYNGTSSTSAGRYTSNGTSFTSWGTFSSAMIVTKTGQCTNGNSVVLNGTTSANSFWAYSTDGWTNISGSSAGSGFNTSDAYVGAINGNEVILCRTTTVGTQFLYSTNAAVTLTLSSHSLGGTSSYTQTCVSFLNGYWLIGTQVGAIGTKTTVDGSALDLRTTLASGNQINGFLYTGTKWVAYGNSGAVSNASAITTWTSRTTGLVGNIVDMAYSGGIIVAVTSAGEIARSADNGDSWAILSSGNNPLLGNAIRFVKFRLTRFEVGGAGGKFGISSDGLSFTLASIGMGSDTITGFEAA